MRRTAAVMVFPMLLLLCLSTTGCECDMNGENCELRNLEPDRPQTTLVPTVGIWSGDNQVGPEGTELAERIVGKIDFTTEHPTCVVEIGLGDGTVSRGEDLSDIPGKIITGEVVQGTFVKDKLVGERCGATWVLGTSGINTVKLHFLRYLNCGGYAFNERGAWIHCERAYDFVVAFTARAYGPPAVLVIRDGNEQTGEAGQPLPIRPSVRVTDLGENPVPGVTVNFFAAAGSGTPASAVSAITGNSGVATMPVDWVLARPLAGSFLLESQYLYAVAQDVPLIFVGSPALFHATAQLPGPPPLVPARIEIVQGDSQYTLAGSPVPLEVRVRVTSDDGTPVPGTLVDFIPDRGTINVSTTATDADGIATPGTWRPGYNEAGTFHLTATVRGSNIANNPVQFTAITSIGQGGTNTLDLYNGSGMTANIFIDGESLAAGNSLAPAGTREVQIFTAINTSFATYAYVGGSQVATTRCVVTAAAWQGALRPRVGLYREGSFYFLLCNNF